MIILTQYASDIITHYYMTQLTSEILETILDKRLTQTEQRLIERINKVQEDLARMTAAGFEDIQKRLDVRDAVADHALKFQRLEEALHIKLG